MHKYTLLFAMALFLLLLTDGCNKETAPSKTKDILAINNIKIFIEIADSPKEREKGLMFRESLAENSGMLFVYPREKERGFWMKNTKIPLSIAFINKEGIILNIEDMTPFSEEGVYSEGNAKYALEVNRDFFEKHGIKRGDKVIGIEKIKESEK